MCGICGLMIGGIFSIRKNHNDSYDVLLHDPDGKINDERLKPMRDSMESYWIIGKIKREIHPHFPKRHWWVIEVPVFSNDKITWVAGDKTSGRYDERMLEGHYPTLKDAVRSIEWWFYEMDGGLDMGSWVEGSWDAESFGAEDEKELSPDGPYGEHHSRYDTPCPDCPRLGGNKLYLPTEVKNNLCIDCLYGDGPICNYCWDGKMERGTFDDSQATYWRCGTCKEFGAESFNSYKVAPRPFLIH